MPCFGIEFYIQINQTSESAYLKLCDCIDRLGFGRPSQALILQIMRKNRKFPVSGCQSLASL
ncbi:unnamed protein product [Moneuplotes crassus]|uniref:Uncharacterized protein n=1 Tax=Euplotes crassus TaxID=5936 RepID=A0AAD1XHJ6_EUPCR|nr:unnamed protein product [Moneuplotes crassus]